MSRSLVRLNFAIAAAFVISAHAGSQETPARAPDELSPMIFIGSWEAECDAFGTPARCESEWRRGLSCTLFEQRYRVTSVEDGSLMFAGHGVYRVRPGGVDGYWSDSQGSIHELYGVWRDGSLVIDWGEPSTDRGRSSYQVGDNARSMTVIDWALTADGWDRFMTVSYDSVAHDPVSDELACGE